MKGADRSSYQTLEKVHPALKRARCFWLITVERRVVIADDRSRNNKTSRLVGPFQLRPDRGADAENMLTPAEAPRCRWSSFAAGESMAPVYESPDGLRQECSPPKASLV
jgi:hypothetical protein